MLNVTTCHKYKADNKYVAGSVYRGLKRFCCQDKLYIPNTTLLLCWWMMAMHVLNKQKTFFFCTFYIAYWVEILNTAAAKWQFIRFCDGQYSTPQHNYFLFWKTWLCIEFILYKMYKVTLCWYYTDYMEIWKYIPSYYKISLLWSYLCDWANNDARFWGLQFCRKL